MIVTIDIPHESVAALMVLCADHAIDVYDRVEEGPAGGNPRFRLGVHNSNALSALGSFYWGD
ncbi:hypothetical protein ACSBOB_26780 [Mesorhizobium sp. ASY16-5R]|uniref:hypothetical protein n=1 Tax=Mesorhizobium sp. ASY16-5R TaxID=3445772 RepID=UPI003F9F63CD